MLILLLFSFLAGIATVLSPCIIPILPAILSGGINKGKLRPLGIITGLIVSFCFFTLTLTALVKATGISPDLIRYIAIFSIFLFGLIMLFPKLSDLFARFTSFAANAGNNLQASSSSQSGIIGGFLLGISLGLLWTPCAGPILASVTTLALTNSVNFAAILLTFAYSIGAGIPLLLIAYGGNRAVNSSRFFAHRAEAIRRVFGVLMMVTAVAMIFNIDRQIQLFTIKYFSGLQPDTNPTVQLELQKLKKHVPFQGNSPAVQDTLTTRDTLPRLGKAPELTGITGWVNSEPITLASLKGKVVLVDFWTYSCINCIRTLPFVTKWYDTYKDKGFVVIGVHTPEFEFEKDHNNVIDATKRFQIHYPVAQDNNYATWNAYSNEYWPAHYLIDQQGTIREVHFGEGDYDKTEAAIQTLLRVPSTVTTSIGTDIKTAVTGMLQKPLTPETYLGYGHPNTYTGSIQIQHDIPTFYIFSEPLAQDEVGISGMWAVHNDRITCLQAPCNLALNFLASKVILVLSGKSQIPAVTSLDATLLPNTDKTTDYTSTPGEFMVNADRAYTIVDLHKQYGRHVLHIKIPPGISAYAFTFGE